MSTEAGWYHADGDPPGTVRRWNGHEWIGFPIQAPTPEGATPSPAAAATPTVHVSGQIGLTPIAVIVQLCLLFVAGASIFLGVSMIQLAPYASTSVLEGQEFLDAAPDGLGARVGISYLLTILAGLLCGVTFVIWFFLAYRNMSLWNNNRRGLAWTVLAWIVPFIALVRPLTMMMELAEKSPLPDKQKDLNPVPIIVWWILWMFSQFGLFFVIAASDLSNVASNLLTGIGFISMLSAVAALIAVYLVQGITDAQEDRRRR